jgi:hypothetical protein
MDTETNPTDAPIEAVTETVEPDDQGLGDAGKAALQAERKARRDAERAAKSLQEELDGLRQASMSEQERALEAARAEARAEALAEATGRLVRAEIRSAAASRLADPDDAFRFIDMNAIEVDDDGNVNRESLTSALDELLTSKPYLSNAAQRVGGDADAGARGTAPASVDMNSLIRRAAGRA